MYVYTTQCNAVQCMMYIDSVTGAVHKEYVRDEYLTKFDLLLKINGTVYCS
jgi:hypothetical protein